MWFQNIVLASYMYYAAFVEEIETRDKNTEKYIYWNSLVWNYGARYTFVKTVPLIFYGPLEVLCLGSKTILLIIYILIILRGCSMRTRNAAGAALLLP
jgi:hypothetical protein